MSFQPRKKPFLWPGTSVPHPCLVLGSTQDALWKVHNDPRGKELEQLRLPDGTHTRTPLLLLRAAEPGSAAFPAVTSATPVHARSLPSPPQVTVTFCCLQPEGPDKHSS